MTGFHNHHFLEEARLIGQYSTVDAYRMHARNPKSEYHVSIPFVSQLPAGSEAADAPEVHVLGELYAVSDEQLQYLDGLEGHPDWYHREAILAAPHGGGDVIACWLYFNERELSDRERLVPVPSGNFRDHEDAPPP